MSSEGAQKPADTGQCKSREKRSQVVNSPFILLLLSKELMMKKLKSFQRKYLRGLSHKLKTVVLIGQKGLTDISFLTELYLLNFLVKEVKACLLISIEIMKNELLYYLP